MIHILMKKSFKACDQAICDIANSLEPKAYTSREFIKELGKFLKKMLKKRFFNRNSI